MTATDELRRLLDERGVEWWDSSDENVLHTTWNDMNCWFNEFPDGWTAWGMAKQGTPEQAIAATLGRGTCRDVGKPAVFKCSECGWYSPVFTFGKEMPQFCPSCGRRVAHDGS